MNDILNNGSVRFTILLFLYNETPSTTTTMYEHIVMFLSEPSFNSLFIPERTSIRSRSPGEQPVQPTQGYPDHLRSTRECHQRP